MLLKRALSAFSHCLTFEFAFRYWERFPTRLGVGRYAHLCLQLLYEGYSTLNSLRSILILVIYQKFGYEHWKDIDPIYWSITYKWLYGDPNLILGYAIIWLFPMMINTYYRFHLADDHKLMLGDLKRIFKHGKVEDIEEETIFIRSNPYLNNAEKLAFLKLLDKIQRLFFISNIMFVSGFLTSVLGIVPLIWFQTTYWTSFIVVSVDVSVVFMFSIYSMSQASFLLLLATLQMFPSIWSLKSHNHELEQTQNKKGAGSLSIHMLILRKVKSCQRVHIDLKAISSQSIGSTIGIVMKNGILVTLLGSVASLIGMYVHDLGFSIKVLMSGLIFMEMFVLNFFAWFLINLSTALHIFASPLAKTSLILYRYRSYVHILIPKRFKVVTFFEMVHTIDSFTFKLGSIGPITRLSLLKSFMFYSSMIMFCMPLAKMSKHMNDIKQ